MLTNSINLGILIDNIGPNQLAFDVIHQINRITKNNNKISFSLFVQNIIAPVIKPLCPVYNISEIMSFNGVMIATNFDTAEKMIKSVNQSLKIFYINELEWIHNPNDFLYYQNIVKTAGLIVFSRSEPYAQALARYAEVDSKAVMPNLEIEQLLNNIRATDGH